MRYHDDEEQITPSAFNEIYKSNIKLDKTNRQIFYAAQRAEQDGVRVTPNQYIKITNDSYYYTPNSEYTLIPFDIEPNKLCDDYDEDVLLSLLKSYPFVHSVMRTNSGGIVPIFLVKTDDILQIKQSSRTELYFNVPFELCKMLDPSKIDVITHTNGKSDEDKIEIKQRYANTKPMFVGDNITQPRFILETVWTNDVPIPLTVRTAKEVRQYKQDLSNFWREHYITKDGTKFICWRVKVGSNKTDYKTFEEIPQEIIEQAPKFDPEEEIKSIPFGSREWSDKFKLLKFDWIHVTYNNKEHKYVPTPNEDNFRVIINKLNISRRISLFNSYEIDYYYYDQYIGTNNIAEQLISSIATSMCYVLLNYRRYALPREVMDTFPTTTFNKITDKCKELTDYDSNFDYTRQVYEQIKQSTDIDNYGLFKHWLQQTMIGWLVDENNYTTFAPRVVLHLNGRQHTGKSTFARWLLRGTDANVNECIAFKSDNAHQQHEQLSAALTEIAEDTMFKRDQMAEFKALSTRLGYQYTAKHDNHSKFKIRRCGIIVSTNEHLEFSNNGDTNTRFITMHIDSIMIDKSNLSPLYMWRQIHDEVMEQYNNHGDWSWFALTQSDIIQINKINAGITATNEYTDILKSKLDWDAPASKWIKGNIKALGQSINITINNDRDGRRQSQDLRRAFITEHLERFGTEPRFDSRREVCYPPVLNNTKDYTTTHINTFNDTLNDIFAIDNKDSKDSNNTPVINQSVELIIDNKINGVMSPNNPFKDIVKDKLDWDAPQSAWHKGNVKALTNTLGLPYHTNNKGRQRSRELRQAYINEYNTRYYIKPKLDARREFAFPPIINKFK